MPGVDFLSTVTKTVSYEEPNIILVIFLAIIVCAISILIGVLADSSFVSVVGIIIGIFLSIIVSFEFPVENVKDVTGYEATISSDTNLAEFYEKYEIIGDPIINENGQKVYFIIEK
jgi:hypothetical protein